MILIEICIIATVLVGVSSRSIEPFRKRILELEEESHTEIWIERYDETAHNNKRPSTVKNNDDFVRYFDESFLEQLNTIPEETDNSDVSSELSEFDKFRQSIFDMIIILFKNKKPTDTDRSIDEKNEMITIDRYIKVENFFYSTNISVNDFVNLMFDLEDYVLKPSSISKTFEHQMDIEINIDTLLKNLGKTFLYNFKYDIDVNNFPLVFYEIIFPYLRKELLPILNKKKIYERTTRFLGYELRRPELFKTFEKISTPVKLVEERLNLRNFFNSLNIALNRSKIDAPFNKEIKLAYKDILSELIGLVKLEVKETGIPVRTFVAIFDALLYKSTPKISESEKNSPKEQEENSEKMVLCPFGSGTLNEVIRLTYYDFRVWFVDIKTYFDKLCILFSVKYL
ncbi:hypothetical protein Anas_09046 [Armadillidium nasatum]|uniref:Uncharacterized protein n=1 Tax=Armadillidium nasatum TaxID=96803 RepID=A0A5N5TC02_9CRUS|nr:hypothetical protein Anas_09046 [Armadillidium nasatum]